MPSEPTLQHNWLSQFVGDWTYEFHVPATADKPASTMTGTENIRMLGNFWLIIEGQDAEDENDTSILTLGYDPKKEQFVGTFVTSMIAYLWPYEGTLDESGTKLSLNSEGPSMKDDGKTAKYRDVIELVADDHRTFTSYTQGEDGEWTEFMTISYHRTK